MTDDEAIIVRGLVRKYGLRTVIAELIQVVKPMSTVNPHWRRVLAGLKRVEFLLSGGKRT